MKTSEFLIVIGFIMGVFAIVLQSTPDGIMGFIEVYTGMKMKEKKWD